MASENEPTDESDETSEPRPSGADRPEMIGSTKVLNFKDLAGGEKWSTSEWTTSIIG